MVNDKYLQGQYPQITSSSYNTVLYCTKKKLKNAPLEVKNTFDHLIFVILPYIPKKKLRKLQKWPKKPSKGPMDPQGLSDGVQTTLDHLLFVS